MGKYIFVLTIVLFAAYPAAATIIHIPADYPTIQQGIDASELGDTVLVQPGIYTESLTIFNRNIVLASHFLTTGDTSFISSTIIDGDSATRVVGITEFDSVSSVIGFTIQHGYFSGNIDGAGIRIIGTAIISYNIIKDNHFHATHDHCGGAGIACYGSGTEISHNTISNNIITDDYYLYGYGGGIYCFVADVMIEYNVIAGNSSCWGGGISLRSSSPVIRNNIIRDNTSYP